MKKIEKNYLFKVYKMPTHYGGTKHHQGGNGKLTQRQKDTMKKHSKHHNKKHMDMMTKLMKEGKTFGESHKIAMKKVGR